MRDLTALLALPAGLLTLLTTPVAGIQALQWPRNPPHAVEAHAERQLHFGRDAELQSPSTRSTPRGVKKMSHDRGEKFFLHYWSFEESDEQRIVSGGHRNGSIPLLQPIAPHSDHARQRRSVFGRNVFARDYDCPSGTSSCVSQGYEDLCCASGESCVATSAGVGCCAEGQTCGDSISDCDASQGYTACATDDNGGGGGCCVPGAQCRDGGCVFYGTQTVYTTLPTARFTSGVATTVQTSSGRVITLVYTSVRSSAYTTTQTVTATPEGATTTRTVVVVDGESSSSSTPDDTDAAGAPILPTTDTLVSAATLGPSSPPTTSTSPPPATCPTGFYMCSARYQGGCCQVDRDCDTTSCPPGATTAVASGDGATVAAAGATGRCAAGWGLCGAEEGGGCCPSGYACGAESCRAEGRQDTGKMAPQAARGAHAAVLGWTVLVLGVGAGVGMVWL